MAGNQAQYAIDIAATMSGGEQTEAELDALTATLTGAGKGAAFFQEAVKALSADLSAAKVASAAAGQALADGNAEYAALEKAALAAARAVDRAAKKGAVPPELNAQLDAAKSAVNSYAVTLGRLEDDAAAAASGEAKLAAQLDNVRKLSGHVDKSFAGQAESLGKVQGALGAVGGPVGRLGTMLLAPQKGFAELSATLGRSGATALLVAAGIGVLVAAVVALTAAVVVGAVKVASWAVSLADSARSVGLAREAVEAMTPGMAALRGEIDAISTDTGQSSAALRGFAKTLQDAKVKASDMPAALRAVALAETALGAGGSAEFVDQIKAGKKSVSALAVEVQAKLGGVVARQMLGLDAQSARLRSNFSSLFSGLDIDPVLNGMQTLVGFFDRTSASGRAIEMLFGKIFQPLIGQAENAAWAVEAFALGFLIGLTKLYIAIKPVINTVAELFGFEDTTLTDVLNVAKKAGEAFAFVFAGAAVMFGVLFTAIGTVIGVVATWNAMLMAAVAAAVVFQAKVVSAIVGVFTQIKGYFAGVNWGELGTNIMLGLARGITGSAGAVLSAIGGAVQGAIARAKSMLGIASPSRVFAGLGEYTGQGFAVGVESQEGAAQDAMTALVAPPMSPLAAVDAGASGGAVAAQAAPVAAPVAAPTASGPATSLNMQGATFNFYGVADAASAERSFGEMLTRLLEGDAAQLGGEAPA